MSYNQVLQNLITKKYSEHKTDYELHYDDFILLCDKSIKLKEIINAFSKIKGPFSKNQKTIGISCVERLENLGMNCSDIPNYMIHLDDNRESFSRKDKQNDIFIGSF